jgi:predicted Zn finger-like uncharacterized protein
MALMTACPQCQAHFKIVPDQLKLHGGLVRCGACSQVFDASKALLTLPTQIQEVAPEAPAWHGKPVVQALAATSVVAAETPVPPPLSPTHKTVQPSKKEVHSPRNTIQNPSVFKRLLYATTLLGLLILAALQVAVLMRDSLAQALPAVKPLLSQLCEATTQCRLEPAKTLKNLHLDVLTLKRLSAAAEMGKPAEYEFIATVRSASGLTVLVPNIELTLTNAQTQTIARRTITSSELVSFSATKAGNTASTIAPYAEWELKGKLFLDPNTLGFAGRLVLAP